MFKTMLFTLLLLGASLAAAQPDPYEPDNQQPLFMAYGTAVDRSLESDINVTGVPDVDHFSMTVRSGESASFSLSNFGSELSPFNIQIVVFRVFLGQRQAIAASNSEVGSTGVGWTEPVNPFGPPLNVTYEVEVYEVEPMATGPDAGYRATFQLTQVVQSPMLSSLQFSANSVKGGKSVTATATLTSPAPAGGALVSLIYSGPISGPASVTVPAGKTFVTFTVNSSKVNTSTLATLRGAYGGRQESDTITVTK